MAILVPDLSDRPLRFTLTRTMATPPAALYRAWTEQFDRWFAAPGSVLMKAEVNVPFFFETHFEASAIPTTGAFFASSANASLR